jgi:amino acid transporter
VLFRVLGGLFGPKALRFVSVFFVVMALVVIAGAVSAAVSDIDLRANGVTTNATVLNVQTSRNYSSSSKTYSTSYTDLIQYTTTSGVQRQASISDSGGLRAGDTVAVVYDPSHPGTIQEKSTLTGLWWIGVVAFLVFALALGWAGVRLWRRASRLREAEAGTMEGAMSTGL